jgi:hypothetical protein
MTSTPEEARSRAQVSPPLPPPIEVIVENPEFPPEVAEE